MLGPEDVMTGRLVELNPAAETVLSLVCIVVLLLV